MGIYYFYTWVTHRYPLIKKKYDVEIVPQIDHLYLDLNGVLHKCAKANSAVFRDLLSGKAMQEIFIEIINYVNFVINLIKPKKSIFLSIDGVAPRAKMNNQRHRRFRTSKNQKDIDEFLLKDLKLNPDLINFKNNSISPGTEFMIELNNHIQFFIKKKIEEDACWHNKKIYLSGGDVPGEGEHKILDFLRGWKQSAEFDINDTHCIYGNDSDLVLLSMISHLPYVMLLKEEMVFNNSEVVNSAANRVIEDPKMEVIFINLLVEYLELEFRSVFEEGNFDLNNLLDDFVLFSFFIGNDFLHQLYCMNTKYGNFDEFMSILAGFYKKEQKYLTHNFEIVWTVWGKLLNEFLHFERKMILTTMKDFDFKISDLEQNKIYQQLKKEAKDENIVNEFDYKLTFKKKDNAKLTNIRKLTHEESLEISSEEENEKKLFNEIYEEEKSKKYLIEFQDQYEKLLKAKKTMATILSKMDNKENYQLYYYQKYFHFNEENLEREIEKVCESYLNGIDFVFKYYYISCPSWEWYYPYPISPLLTDIYKYINKKIELEQSFQSFYKESQPLLPYHQLLFILPKDSLNLLPDLLVKSALNPDNGISQFYPEDFNVIPYDQQKDYTWIPDVAEIDEDKLFEFISKFDWSCLSDEEKFRNRVGRTLFFKYDPSSQIDITPTVPGFETLKACIKIEEFDLQDRFKFDKEEYLKTKEKESSKSAPIANTKFPTFKIYKHYKLVQIKHKKKVVSYLMFTKKTIKTYWEKFNQQLKIKQKKNDKNSSLTVYLNPIFGKTMISNEYYRLKTNQEFHKETSDTIEFQKSNYILLEKNDFFDGLKYVNVFILESPTFSHMDYQSQKPRILLKSDYESGFQTSFLNISLKKNYKSLREYESIYNSNFYSTSHSIDLKTGHLYQIKKEFNHEANLLKEKDYHLISLNNFVQNIQVSNKLADVILINEGFLKKIGLEKNEILVLWLILDSFKILTDLSEHNSLILGDAFDIGLNFIQIINKKVENWKIVNDMVRIINKPNDKDDNYSCSYDCPIQKMRKKRHVYNIILTKTGAEQVMLYFEENKEIIEFLKKECRDSKLTIMNKFKKLMIKNRFRADEILVKKDKQSINIDLFNIYAKLVQKTTSNLLFQPSLSVIYPSETIEAKLLNFNKKEESDTKIQHPLFLLKNHNFKEVVWPALSVKPSYHSLGDRVAFINNFNKHIKFGVLGIVIGIYKDFIEILFDKPFIGATDLRGRCPNFRGSLVLFFEVFNLTKWSKTLVGLNDPENVKKNIWNGDFSIDGLLKLLKSEQLKITNQFIN